MAKDYKTILSIQVDLDDLIDLDEIAEKNGLTRPYLIRNILKGWLNDTPFKVDEK